MSAFLTIAIIHLMGVASPGPDFLIVTRSALTYSRKTGIWTALGVALGIMVHVAYCLLGIGIVISQSIVLFNTIKYIGAAYLIYIGWLALTQKPTAKADDAMTKEINDISAFDAVKIGFLTNALNPKASIFFLALFTQVMDPATPLLVQMGYGIYLGVATFAWFAGLATVLSIGAIRRNFKKIQLRAEKAMGGLLILLGLKVALSSQK